MDFEAELKRVKKSGWQIGGSDLPQALAVAAGTKPVAFLFDNDDTHFHAIRGSIAQHNMKIEQQVMHSPEYQAAMEAVPIAEVHAIPEHDYTCDDLIRFLQEKGCACTSYYTVHAMPFDLGLPAGAKPLFMPEKHILVYPKDHPERKEQYETLMKELYTHQIDRNMWHRRFGKLLGYPPAEIDGFAKRHCANDIGKYDESVDMVNTVVKSEFPALYDVLQRKDPLYAKLLGPRNPSVAGRQ